MVVSYKVEKPVADWEVGQILQLEEEDAKALVEAGILAAATQEDIDGGVEEESVEAPEYVENAAKDLEAKLAQAVEKATKKIAESLKTKAANVSIPTPKAVVPAQAKDDTWGFSSLGDYAKCVISSETGDLAAMRKLQGYRTKSEMTTGGGPTVTATGGGNLIPPAYSAELFQKMKGVTNLIDFVQDEPFTGNTLEIPIDNTTAFSNGITVAWTSEASPVAASTLPLSMVELKLNNLAALVNVTQYLQDDNAYSLDNYLKNNVPMKMAYELNRSVLYGTGNGANIVGNAATITVTRTTANRIKTADIYAMYSRMAEWNLPNAKWFISPSILPEMLGLAFQDGASQSYPVYLPQSNGGYPNLAYRIAGTLLGHEVVLCSNMQALGTNGDILFADLGAASKIQKSLDGQSTPYLYFDKLISTLRFVLRIGTKSRWTAPFTRPDSVTCSPFVTLSGNSLVP